MDDANHARRLIRRHAHEVNATPEVVFPLLCPTREYDWVPGWQCTLVYSDSGYAEPRCVFTTDGPGGSRAVWAVSRYDLAARRIAFVITVPGSHVEHLDVRVEPMGAGRARVTWQRVFTALEAAAAEQVARAAGIDFDTKMAWIARALQYHVETGGCLDPAAHPKAPGTKAPHA